MYTYQDYLEIDRDNEKAVMDFVKAVIEDHKNSDLYKTAVIADDYDRHINTTITQYQKLLYTITGKAVPDNYSSNFKLASRFFNRFIVQETQYLLGNGVTWQNDSTGEKLGEDFDNKLQEAGREALKGAVSFGFFNKDHLDVFSVNEYAPLYDEENGALMAGVRFWQIDDTKPLRATFYEIDGYTEYIWTARKTLSDNWQIIDTGKGKQPKKAYIQKYRQSDADGLEIYDGENYPAFPIVPLWGNPHHQSELVGLREQIDCYDLIKSGFANTVDEGSIIYWLIQNAGGMDDIDLVKFVERVKTLHAAAVDEGQTAEPHTIEPPYQSREVLLEKLRSDLYDDAMALDTKNIASGAVTATQIKAAYEPLNSKTDQFEFCVLEFLRDILALAGITDENPTFTRSVIVNTSEEIGLVLQATSSLDEEYVTKKILTLLGDGDQADEIIERMHADELERASGSTRTPTMYEITSVLGKLKRGDITERTAMSMLQRIGLSEEEAEETIREQSEEIKEEVE